MPVSLYSRITTTSPPRRRWSRRTMTATTTPSAQSACARWRARRGSPAAPAVTTPSTTTAWPSGPRSVTARATALSVRSVEPSGALEQQQLLLWQVVRRLWRPRRPPARRTSTLRRVRIARRVWQLRRQRLKALRDQWWWGAVKAAEGRSAATQQCPGESVKVEHVISYNGYSSNKSGDLKHTLQSDYVFPDGVEVV